MRGGHWYAIATIAVVGTIALAPAVSLPFAGDDAYILENLQSPSLQRNLFAFHFDAPGRNYAPWYVGARYQRRFVRLLPSALLTLEARLFDRTSAAYHALTLVVHLTTCVGLYLLLSSFWDDRRVALMAALIPAVHPAAAEIVGLANSQPIAIAAAAGLAAVAAWIHLRRSGRAWAGVLAVAAALVAVTSYEALVILPFLIVGVDLAIRREASWRPRLALLAVVAVYAPIYWAVHHGVPNPETTTALPLAEAWRATRVDGSNYVFRTLALFNAASDHPWEYGFYSRLGEPLAPLLALAIVVAACVLARRDRAGLVGLIAFAVLLAPPFLMRITVSRLNVPSFRQLYLPVVFGLPLVAIALTRRAWPVLAAFVVAAGVQTVFVGTRSKLAVDLRHIRSEFRTALAGAEPSHTLAIVGAGGCPYFANFDWRGPILHLAPRARTGPPPELTVLDDHTVRVRADAGFAMPFSAPEPFPAPPHGRFWNGGFRVLCHVDGLATLGRERIDGATIELAGRNEHDATELRIHLDRPVAEHVFLAVEGCKSARRIDVPHP